MGAYSPSLPFDQAAGLTDNIIMTDEIINYDFLIECENPGIAGGKVPPCLCGSG